MPKNAEAVIMALALCSLMLPSLITQLNWMSPTGLLPYEERKKWLIVSWVLFFVGVLIIWLWMSRGE